MKRSAPGRRLFPHRTGAHIVLALPVALPVALLVALGVFTGCTGSDPETTAPETAEVETEPEPETVAVPEPDTTDMEPQVEEKLRAARQGVLANPESAEAWGRFGRVAHAHELWDEARIAYERAWELDPSDERWPYFLGDVLSVVGTDLEAATRAFERTLALRPGYAPAHMRLGRVLVARGLQEEAAEQFQLALEGAPDLQQARVGLAQVWLSQGDLERAEELLDEVLAEEPRHGQALSTLGQVYMRQGRRDEAREVAERARAAALYNLFADPLMGQVVQEEASSVLLWERAKAFFDNGDYEQAALGLQEVVERRPTNPDVHHQLAVAYGNLDRHDLTRHHLERVVALDGDRVEARVQLAVLHLEEGRPAEAIPHLRRVLELAPEDPDAGWLLGRARVLSGDPEGGLAAFEQARAKAAGRPVPGWAHNEWGSALAQTGRPQEALDHFRAALEADPDNPQALFYTGLIHEGLGRIDRAVELYCRSMAAQPNPPAAGRLRALSRSCGELR